MGLVHSSMLLVYEGYIHGVKWSACQAGHLSQSDTEIKNVIPILRKHIINKYFI
jgi:hypothetical protein